MGERPILFSGAMVRAILEGRKTQTRRVMKHQPQRVTVPGVGPMLAIQQPRGKDRWLWPNAKDELLASCPYGQPGDRLWVRETWGPRADGFVYRATEECSDPMAVPNDDRWHPSIHMPRAACRLVLEITDVRVERLQAISYDDALAEGVMDGAQFCEALEPGKRNAIGESAEETAKRLQWPQRSFERLWASINGQASWDANPWVWALTFRRVAHG